MEQKPLNPFENPSSFIVPVETLIPEIKPRTEVYENIDDANTGAAFPDQFLGYLADSIEPWIFNEKIVKEEIEKRKKGWDFILQDSEARNKPELKELALKKIGELRSDIEKENPLTAIFKHFQGQIVIDLGAGESCYVHNLCSVINANAYIGVEKFFADTLKNSISKSTTESIEREFSRKPDEVKPIPAAIEKEDMLSFLRRLPDNSVSIFASGLDTNVIPDRDYRKQVRNELQRVLHPNGALITNEAPAMEFMWDNINLERPSEKHNTRLYRKNPIPKGK
jgi:hypothetical protein